jgi:hypothetical protein
MSESRYQWKCLAASRIGTSRLRDRKITVDDLYQLKVWRESQPEAPEGLWFKDFGSFKGCGEGKFPKTFLLRGQAARGQKL